MKNFEIIQGALVVTDDENSDKVIFECPKGLVYYDTNKLEAGDISLYDVNTKEELFFVKLADAGDGNDAFDEVGFRAFARLRLGFNTALGGSEAKRYYAKLTQTGTNAPTAVVLQNTTGITITPTYVSAGSFTLTFSEPVDLDKVGLLMGSGINITYTGLIHASFSSTTVITILTRDFATTTLTNGILNNVAFEVLIFP